MTRNCALQLLKGMSISLLCWQWLELKEHTTVILQLDLTNDKCVLILVYGGKLTNLTIL